MPEDEYLNLELDFWDDTVGAFEPLKVLRQLELAFPDVEIDPTDYQRVRLLRELEFWSQGERETELRDRLVSSSWNLYSTNGPSYRFVLPFPSGHRVRGSARRLTVGFQVPADLPAEDRAQLVAFLNSLRMGTPAMESLRA